MNRITRRQPLSLFLRLTASYWSDNLVFFRLGVERAGVQEVLVADLARDQTPLPSRVRDDTLCLLNGRSGLLGIYRGVPLDGLVTVPAG